jgi:hypothetical protein
MTGREKVEAAFSRNGTPEFPVVICYEGIFVRDHWDQLVSQPWYAPFLPDLDRQIAWYSEVIEKINQDWFVIEPFYSNQERAAISIEERPDGVYLVNRQENSERKLERPRIGGWPRSGNLVSVKPEKLPSSSEEIDEKIPIPDDWTPDLMSRDGRDDLARCLLAGPGRDRFPISHIPSPIWRLYGLWGFEGMMFMIASRPDLVRYACERLLVLAIRRVYDCAALGARGIWIEECLTDMISPEVFKATGLLFLRRLIEEIRMCRMKSIYYYCGNPSDRLEILLSAGADALALEESKKGFHVDIEDIADKVNGRCTILGNLDAVNILEKAPEKELIQEIRRQMLAGRRNRNKFIMSTGSPVTPSTTIERVQRYCRISRELCAGDIIIPGN